MCVPDGKPPEGKAYICFFTTHPQMDNTARHVKALKSDPHPPTSGVQAYCRHLLLYYTLKTILLFAYMLVWLARWLGPQRQTSCLIDLYIQDQPPQILRNVCLLKEDYIHHVSIDCSKKNLKLISSCVPCNTISVPPSHTLGFDSLCTFVDNGLYSLSTGQKGLTRRHIYSKLSFLFRP